MLNILNYKLYKHAWIDKCAPHHGEKLSQDDIRLLLSNGGDCLKTHSIKKRLRLFYIINTVSLVISKNFDLYG